MNKRRAGQAAPYGQACLQCFKSKCKCVLRSEGDKCERCYRLKRECDPSEPIRRRRAPKSQKSIPKFAQLEGRIDSLVTLLRNVGESSNASTELRSVLDSNASKTTSQLLGAHSESGTEVRSSCEPKSAPATNATSSVSKSSVVPMTTPPTDTSPIQDSSTSSLSTPIGSLDTSPENVSATSRPQTEAEQEIRLELFRTGMLPRCPFVSLPPEISAASLRHSKPLFFKAICAVTAPSRQEKVERGNELKRLIAAQMVVENTSSMDILFALLTFVAWSNDFLYSKAGLSRYMMLAMSIVYDLRLHNPEKAGDWSMKKDKMLLSAGKITPSHCEVDEQLTGDLFGRCRAVLGCFVLSRCVSSHFNQIDSLQWTAHLDECLRLLESHEDEPSDATLIFLTRLHRTAQKAVDIHRQLDGTSPAIMLYLTAVRDQLWEFKVPQVSNVGLQGFLQAHLWYMELCIWDALGDCQLKTLDPIIGSSSLRTQRIEYLWKSVTAVKSSIDIILSLSPLTWVGVSILEISQITKSFKTLLYLALHDDPAWDKQAARDVCDPMTVLSQVIRISDEVSVAVGETSRDDIFKTLGNHTRGLREWARFSLGETVDVSSTNDGESVERAADDSWNLPPFFSTFAMPSYAFGTGDWMERTFDQPY